MLDALALLPGIDLQRALKMVRGKKAFYLSVLRQFADRRKLQLAELEAGLAARDRESARRISHTLKGSSGSLGLDRIFDAVAALNAALRQPDYDAGQVQAVFAEIRDAAHDLLSVLGERP